MRKIFLSTLLAMSCTHAFAENYKIIVDAGSTGCRLHLFQYEAIKGVPVIKDIFSESNKIPLSSFANHPENVRSSLETLLNNALNKIANPSEVKVEILATGGMRSLPQDKQAEIYQSIRTFLQKNYVVQIGKIETITGQMEGLYAWLDVNYLAKTFEYSTPSVGTIDMGGASTQIAFETQDVSKPEDLITIKIHDQTYTVFSKSFLGLGQDQARGQMNQLSAFETCYPKGYAVHQSTGIWDLTQCASLYAQVINHHQVAEQIVSTNNQHFYAFSGAYYTYHFLDADKPPDQISFEKRIQNVCTQSWEDLKKNYPDVSAEYLSSYCANAAYMNELFYRVYQLRERQLSVVSKVNDQGIDWTLGVVLYEM